MDEQERRLEMSKQNQDYGKEEDILNPCGHRNSERVKALKKLPSAVCPACLLERIKELEAGVLQVVKDSNDAQIEASAKIRELEERIEALEQLLVCYRVGKNPSEALHRKLEKTKQALKGG